MSTTSTWAKHCQEDMERIRKAKDAEFKPFDLGVFLMADPIIFGIQSHTIVERARAFNEKYGAMR